MKPQPGFVARFSDECRRCGGEVQGQRVVRVADNHVIHVGCASGQDDD